MALNYDGVAEPKSLCNAFELMLFVLQKAWSLA